MLFSLKFMLAMLLILGGAVSILLGYQKWKWALKLVFGKEKVQKRGTKLLGVYLYVIGGGLVLIGLLLLT